MRRVYEGTIFSIDMGEDYWDTGFCIFCGSSCQDLRMRPLTAFSEKDASIGPICHLCLSELASNAEQACAEVLKYQMKF